MSKVTLTPIKLQSPLAGTPAQPPRYAVAVRLKSGEAIQAADPRATRALVALMDMQAQMGGAASHWGGPAAFAELMSAFHGVAFHESQKMAKPWHELFHFVNDAGHCENGLYALKANYGFADLTFEALKKFRSIESVLTGHGEVHLFPTGIYISNGPLGSGLPQAQGLCFADALAGRDRITVAAISDGGCMEGEAREALAAIPGLAARGKMAPFVLVISDNNTKLSGRIDQDSYSMEPTFASLVTMGWKVLSLGNGHDLEACAQAFDQAFALVRANPNQPIAIHAKTIKGYSVEKTERSASGGHGFPLKEPSELMAFLEEIYKLQSVPEEFVRWSRELEAHAAEKAAKPKSAQPAADSRRPWVGLATEKVQAGVAAAMVRKKQEGLPLVSVTSDLPGSTGVADFQKKFPESSLDVGIAEANMISVAIGLSKEGFIPVVDTFAQFGVTKGNLPLIMAALSEGPVIGVFSHVGFQDAADGASHQALTYFSTTAGIPHTDCYALTASEEADALVGQALERFYRDRKEGRTPRSQIFFLGRENFAKRYTPENYRFELGKAQVIYDSSSQFNGAVTIVAAGALLIEALKAAEALEATKVGVIVVNPSIINRPDVETLRACLDKTAGRLVTAEDHQLAGGMGAMIVHALAQRDIHLKVRSLGVKDEFGQSAYQAGQLYKKHDLDAAAIVRAAQQII